jgi:hypothetical protein
MLAPSVFTGNRNRLFFPAAKGLAAFFGVIEGDFDDPVATIAEAAAMFVVMIFPAGAAVAEINSFGFGTSVFAKKKNKQ